MKRFGVVLVLVLAFCGIAVSAYISQSEAAGVPLICNVQSFSDCNVVVASAYSRLFGISLADFGLLFYTVLFVVAAFELVLFNQLLRRIIQGLALVSIIFSVYSVYTQAFLIRALCIYCLTSAVITIFIFIFASVIEPLRKNAERPLLLPTP
ncbi:MAG: vitamin K epoxide reductase family protein [Candidatus Paceibacterota bacterium]